MVQAEGDILTASARLCQLLDLDPSVRLHAIDGYVVPAPIVPDPIPLPELLAIALTQRPGAGRTAGGHPGGPAGVARGEGAALLAQRRPRLQRRRLRRRQQPGRGRHPAGDGTVLQQSRFDNFAGRQDFDAVVYWTLRNLGVGNLALVRLAQSNVRSEDLRRIEVLDRVRAEVAAAYAATHARYAQIDTGERAVRSGKKAFQEDLERTRNQEGLAHRSARQLPPAGAEPLRRTSTPIIDYNRAQFELYVALGQPPLKALRGHPDETCPCARVGSPRCAAAQMMSRIVRRERAF